MPRGSTTQQVLRLLDRIREGDHEARGALIERSCERLRRLARRMLRDYARLRRWEETDDVLQDAMLRLYRSLADVTPEDVSQYFGLAATQVRRTLIDLARHHFGKQGQAARHATDHSGAEWEGANRGGAPTAAEPSNLPQWTRFHQQVEQLPEQDQEVFNLLWYEGLCQQDAAELLGVDVRTVRRRWRAARLLIHDALDGQSPE